MKYISHLILTEQEAKDHIFGYENECKNQCREDPRPYYWNSMTDQEKIDFIFNTDYWFQNNAAGIDVVDVLRSVEVI